MIDNYQPKRKPYGKSPPPEPSKGYTISDAVHLLDLAEKYGMHSDEFLHISHLVANHGLHVHDAETIYTDHLKQKLADPHAPELEPHEQEKIYAMIRIAVDKRGRKGVQGVLELRILREISGGK